jgi:hypothetical protein
MPQNARCMYPPRHTLKLGPRHQYFYHTRYRNPYPDHLHRLIYYLYMLGLCQAVVEKSSYEETSDGGGGVESTTAEDQSGEYEIVWAGNCGRGSRDGGV